MKFFGATPDNMLADKISTISSNKVFRRIKDVLDLYYLSQLYSFDKNNILSIINKSKRSLEKFTGFLNRREDLEHAYMKFYIPSEIIKPDFSDLYMNVKKYISCFLPEH